MLDVQTALRDANPVALLTVKKLLGPLPKVKPAEKQMLCIVYGFVSNLKASHDERGVKVTVFGDFLAFPIVDDKRPALRSNVASFPGVISELLVSAEVGDGRCAEFGFRVGIMGDDSVVGYHYVVERFIGLDAFAPLERLISGQVANEQLEAE